MSESVKAEASPSQFSKEALDRVVTDTLEADGYEKRRNGVFVESGMKTAITNRQISMCALMSVIGPGILIGAGNALAKGGPVGLLAGFAIIAILVMAMMVSLGEMNALLDSNFGVLGSRFVSKGFGATLQIFYVIVWITVLTAEYTNLTGAMDAYTTKVPQWAWVIVFWAFFTLLSSAPCNWYGWLEYVLGWIKLTVLTGFYIFAIIYAAGGIKGHKPDNPMGKLPLNGGFKGIANSFVYAGTFYSGVESISVLASESRNPGKALPIAVRQTVFRIFFVYFGIAISYGITVPYNDVNLTSDSKVLKAPMDIALTEAGWNPPAPHYFIATFILVTCISSINSAIFVASRALFTWSKEGYGPKIFSRVNKQGVPFVAVHTVHLFCFLSIMSWKAGSAVAYSYIVNVSGVAAFIVWTSILVVHLRFRKGLKVQGYDIAQLPYRAPFFPYFQYVGIVIGVLLTLVQGWTVFKPFQVGPFIDAYILLPLFFVFWAAYDLYFHSRIVKPRDMDFETGRRNDLDDDLKLQEG